MDKNYTKNLNKNKTLFYSKRMKPLYKRMITEFKNIQNNVKIKKNMKSSNKF